MSQIFLKTKFQECANRDCKQLFRSLLLMLNFILIVVLTFYFVCKEDQIIHPTTVIAFQICLSLGILLTIYWTALLGTFLSFSAFTIPFFMLLINGQMAGEKLDDESEKAQTLVVWEWMLYPVGTALYFFSFVFYWIFRRLRRNFYIKDTCLYTPQCFEPNRTLLEFLLNYKTASTKEIEASLQQDQQDKLE